MRAALLGFLVLAAIPAYAHSDGPSFETEVGEYRIDIGYSEETPTTEDVVLFDFGIYEAGNAVAYDDVWVRIEQDGAVVFAGGIHNSPFGGARLSYRFPDAGAYTVFVRFESGQESLAEASFPLQVVEGAGADFPYLFVALAFVAGAGAAALFMRRTRA